MAEVATKEKPAITTAEDALKRKSADPNIVSGDHLVAPNEYAPGTKNQTMYK
jgi:hypothetical protein